MPMKKMGWPARRAPQHLAGLCVVCCRTTLPDFMSIHVAPEEWAPTQTPCSGHTSIPWTLPLAGNSLTIVISLPAMSHNLIWESLAPVNTDVGFCQRTLFVSWFAVWGSLYLQTTSRLRPSLPTLEMPSMSLETLANMCGAAPFPSGRGHKSQAWQPRVWRTTFVDCSSISTRSFSCLNICKFSLSASSTKTMEPSSPGFGFFPDCLALAFPASGSRPSSRAFLLMSAFGFRKGVRPMSKTRRDSPGCGIMPADWAVTRPCGEMAARSLM
mmetsp:Transcript_11649/g.24593  ORF Transcript_11649/g.24593 Transcript_11649/m.24593 type:complete len:270 (-) Transcript_11649:104-913(-)